MRQYEAKKSTKMLNVKEKCEIILIQRNLKCLNKVFNNVLGSLLLGFHLYFLMLQSSES